jgi:hypothetical protein
MSAHADGRLAARLYVVGKRVRQQVGTSERRCDVCGAAPLLVMESRNKRRGQALFDLRWRAHRRTYELCPQCGCRYEVADGRLD